MKFKEFIVAIVLLLVSQAVKAQIILIPEVQTGGIVLRQQIFSCLINNLTGSTRSGIFVIQLVDKQTSQVMFEATSNQVLINPGSKRITYNELSPLFVNQSVSEFALDKSMTLPIPIGEYILCYKIYDMDDKRDLLASECVKISAESLAPPHLVYPEDGSALTEPRPIFSWTPPAPASMFSSLSYDVLVTAKFKGQSAEEAIQRNIPILITNSFRNSFPYPASFSDLEPGKDYVWQVIAKDGNRYGGKSEVWGFTLVPDSVNAIIESASFVKIQEDQTEVSVLHQGNLKIDYINNLNDSLVKVSITDVTKLNKKILKFEINVKPGQNLIQKDINKLGQFEEGHIYKLTIINSRKEEFIFRFIPKYYF